MFAHTSCYTYCISVCGYSVYLFLLSLSVCCLQSLASSGHVHNGEKCHYDSRHAHVYHVNVLSVTVCFVFSDLMAPLQYAILKKD